MINIICIDEKSKHYIIQSDEPIRIEILKHEEGYLFYGYKGLIADLEQEPDIIIDTENLMEANICLLPN